jgi:ubiquinone/menaquinone biosynthesis C-methylase UbiE
MSNWERFNKRSEKYDLYRPRYPDALLNLMEKEAGLSGDSVVADVGSGTGLLTELLLREECKLYCIEPNGEMRNIAKEKFYQIANCSILEGAAEATSLPDDSVDIITAGQAFHWFDKSKSKAEFRRILKRSGKVVLVWNTRVKSSEGINPEYERLVKKYSKDYHASGVGATNTDAIKEFFNENFRYFELKNDQLLNTEGLLGRYLSASYAISENDHRFGQMKNEFAEIFETFEENGKVKIDYKTEVFIGSIDR